MSEPEPNPINPQLKLSQEDLIQAAFHDLKNSLTLLSGYVEFGADSDNLGLSLALKEVSPYVQALVEVVNAPTEILRPLPENKKNLTDFLGKIREKIEADKYFQPTTEQENLKPKLGKNDKDKDCWQIIMEETDYYLEIIERRLKDKLLTENVSEDKDCQLLVPVIFRQLKRLKEFNQDIPWLIALNKLMSKYQEASPILIVNQVINNLKQEAGKHSLEFNFSSDLKNLVFLTDPKLLSRILLNLIGNAIRYSKKDKKPIKITLSVSDDFLAIAVKDYGIGLSQEIIDNPEVLFEPGTRTREAKKHSRLGTGYGLFLSQQLAQKLGGQIKVSSSGLGQGSTFSLYLPLCLTKN